MWLEHVILRPLIRYILILLLIACREYNLLIWLIYDLSPAERCPVFMITKTRPRAYVVTKIESRLSLFNCAPNTPRQEKKK